MKKFSLGIVALAATLAGPAMAADMPVKAPPPPPIYDWSGIYLGVDFGWARSRFDQAFVFPPPAAWTIDADRNYVVSGHWGIQAQWGWLVAGIEGGISVFSGPLGIAGPCGAACAPATSFWQGRMNEVWTGGVRLGIAWNQWLFYGTGGWASGTFEEKFGPNALVVTQGSNTRHSGWYGGVGVDWMVHKGTVVDAILGFEYRHYEFNDQNFVVPVLLGGGPVPANTWTVTSPRADTVMARLTIKTHGWDIFYSPAPAITK